MPTGTLTYFDNDAQSVNVSLTYPVVKDQVAVVETFVGIVNKSGSSGQGISLNIDGRGYQFSVPSTLTVTKGQIVYLDTTALVGHTPTDAAYSTTAGANKIRLFRAMENKDANNVVVGILLTRGQLS